MKPYTLSLFFALFACLISGYSLYRLHHNPPLSHQKYRQLKILFWICLLLAILCAQLAK